MNVETEIYIERGDEKITVQVSCYLSPYVPAKISGPPEHCHPEEGGELEDLKATVNGADFELTADEIVKAEDALQQTYDDACESIAVDRAEQMAEDRANRMCEMNGL